MQKEITKESELLSYNGTLVDDGWARRPYWKYDRRKIKANKFRIKEWDYYEFADPENKFGIMGTFSDLGFAGLFVICFIDYELNKTSQVSAIKLLTLHKTGLAPTPDEDHGISFANKEMTLSFVKKGEKRQIVLSAPALELPDGRVGLKANVELWEERDMESIYIATSWKENRKCFYYNAKVNPLPASGIVWLGDDRIELSDKALGNLDWGRGRWTRENTWYWGALNGYDGDIPWGINMGYGFSDRTPASENGIIYDGKVHKLEDIAFDYPEDFVSRKWVFKDNKGRLYLEMNPSVNRHELDNIAGIIVSKQNQVFGIFSGYFILDDGRKIEIADAYGFAEKVYNKW